MASNPLIETREAGPDDAERIARIYNQGIEDHQATLETQLRTPEGRREWLAARGPRHPVLASFPSNEPAARLYTRQGVRTVGVYHEQGRLDCRWVDVILVEKLLP